MTAPHPDDPWTRPEGRYPPPQPASGAPQQQGYPNYAPTPFVAPQHPYGAPQPQQNWGMAVPGASYAMLVPRPPRPASVKAAIALTYAGVVLAVGYAVVTAIVQWRGRAELTEQVTAADPAGRQFAETAVSFTLMFTLVAWLLVAVGVVVTTVLTNRKKNPARIVLVVMMGVFGLNHLCGLGSAGLLAASADTLDRLDQQSQAPTGFSFSQSVDQLTWWSLTVTGLLTVISLTVFVLLLVPATNRYFSAGAGRRFASEV